MTQRLRRFLGSVNISKSVLKDVAAGVSPAVEPGILPGGFNRAGWRDATLYVRRDA